MYDLGQNSPRKKRGINWLSVDAWVDSFVANGWETAKDRYNAASSFFARFRLSGVQRGLSEVGSEALTLVAAAMLVLYGLAIPALIDFDEEKIHSVKYSVTFLDRHGMEIGKRGILMNDAVPLAEIPDHLIKATLATEDRRFFEHRGFDVFGTFRAFVTNVSAGETVQGGSTLTQQLAKNLFLSPERSMIRKLKEAYMALLLEVRLSKNEILKLYLDRAYMGGGTFGVEAAAQFYFGKSVRHVNLAEAAMMAGLFKAPTAFAPHVNLSAARARANIVLSNMVDAGYLTAGQVEHARRNPASPIENRTRDSPDWFLDWAFEQAQRLAADSGHFVLVARTTIDLGLQAVAEQTLQSTVRQYRRTHNVSTGAVVSMEPDGAVRAMVGGMNYGDSQFNRATHARRQPGSSFKIYVYAAAFEEGMTPATAVRDAAPAPCGPRNWQPRNYSGDFGSGARTNLREAFKRSLNTVASDLALHRLGPNSRSKLVEFTEQLGIRGIQRSCSIALGDTGITPLEHTAATAAITNNGFKVEPYGILELTTLRGDVIYTREVDKPEPVRVMSQRTVESMNDVMQAVVNEGTGRAAALEMTHAVGKTGTSSSYRDAWFVGYTSQMVTSVWVGNDDYSPMRIIPSARFGSAQGVTGGSIPSQIWQKVMTAAHPNQNIPTLAGLQPHFRLIEEQRRLAEMPRSGPAGPQSSGSVRSLRASGAPGNQTRDILRRLAATLKAAADGPLPSGDTKPPARSEVPPIPPPGKRADAPVAKGDGAAAALR